MLLSYCGNRNQSLLRLDEWNLNRPGLEVARLEHVSSSTHGYEMIEVQQLFSCGAPWDHVVAPHSPS